MKETRVQSLGQEDTLKNEMATHFSILAWEIPWTEEPGGLQSTGLQRVGHDWACVRAHTHTHTYTHSLVNKVVAQSHLPLCSPMDYNSPWNSPGQNTGVGNLSLLQEIFPTQESNPGFPHCRQILYQLSHKGSPTFKVMALIYSQNTTVDFRTLSIPHKETLHSLLLPHQSLSSCLPL